MKYLDERIYATVEFSQAVSTAGMYQYSIFDIESPAINIFIGNLYLEKGILTKTVDITDIARNYCMGKNKIIMLIVGVKIDDGEPEGFSDYIVPIYRYPNAKADDLSYEFGTDGRTYETFLVSGKRKMNDFFYSDSLLPTYPKIVTDKINIDYLYGTGKAVGKSVFTFDYGPTYSVTQTINDAPSLYNLSYPLALGSATDLNPYNNNWTYNWGTFDTDPTTYYSYSNNKNYINYQLQTTVPIDEVNWQFAGGTNNFDTPSSYPYSLTITDTDKAQEDDYICDFYVYNTEVGDIINTFPSVDEGNYTCEVKCDISEELVTLDGSDITWDDWTWRTNYWMNNSYRDMQHGVTIIKVTLKGDDDYTLYEKTDIYVEDDPFTFEWSQTDNTVVSATIDIDDGYYTTDIPLEIMNNQSGDSSDYKNLVISITADSDGVPIVYINYSYYTINIAYNSSIKRSGVVDLADTISVYKSNKYKFTQTDNDYTFVVDGDLEVDSNGKVTNTAICKSYNIYFYQNGVATKQSNSSGNFSWISLSNTIIGDSYLLIQYTDYDNELHEGRVWIKPTNPNSDSYYSVDFDLEYIAQDGTFYCSLSSGSRKRFAKSSNLSTTIGKFGCPSGYYLLWQDRLGSQQCQPFNKVDTYSEEIDGSEITNYWGKRSLYKVEVQPKWKVQTGWITDEAYRCYEGLFVSPWLKLYDADSDIIYDVILKDRDFTEKTFLNQGKLFNLEVTLEKTEKQNILY